MDPHSILSTTNSTMHTVGGPMMYGPNGFIDILFKNIMENGIEGVSVLCVLFQAYAYLSLEKIKELIKQLNESICDKGKIYIDKY